MSDEVREVLQEACDLLDENTDFDSLFQRRTELACRVLRMLK